MNQEDITGARNSVRLANVMEYWLVEEHRDIGILGADLNSKEDCDELVCGKSYYKGFYLGI